MKRNYVRFATIAAMGAGMAFAQAPAAPAPAQPKAGFHAMMQQRGMMRQRWMQELNLSPDQKDKAKAIFDQARETNRPVRQEMRQNRESLEAAVKAGDQAKMRQLSTEQGRLMGKMIATRSEAMSKFYTILTPDQRAKADQLRKQFRERMKERMERGTTE